MADRRNRQHDTGRLPILRREKRSPDADAVHTLVVGVPVAVILYLTLPVVFHWFAGLPW